MKCKFGKYEYINKEVLPSGSRGFRQRVKNKMAVLKNIVFAFLFVAMVKGKIEEYTFETHYQNNVIAKQQIEVDRENEYLLAKITPIQGDIIPTENLHDFASGYTAIKDEARDTCYILEVGHTLEEMMETFKESVENKGYFDVNQAFACTEKRFVPDEEKNNFGEKIAEFCEGDQLVYSKKHFLSRRKRSTNMIAGNAMICGVCVSLWCG